MKKIWKDNALSIVFILFFLISFIAQIFTGHLTYNEELQEKTGKTLGLLSYLSTGHFIEATFENWESEFLQMGLFVLLSVKLYQRGSSESKDPDKKEEVNREPNPLKKDAPWPVKKGGAYLWIYKNSLSISFVFIFLVSFFLHWYGSAKLFNAEQRIDGLPTKTMWQYIDNANFWFESFQNWQSEFLSIFCIIVFTIFLRQKGSPQSKPVDAANTETGG